MDGDFSARQILKILGLNLRKEHLAFEVGGETRKLAADVRDRVSFSYQHGGASLLDYLDSEKSYRDTRLAYLNLIGSYMTAAAQMNQAVGREVLQ